jgi:hypothetical protein
MTDGGGVDAGHDPGDTPPIGPLPQPPGPLVHRLACDLVRELSIYQLAAEHLRSTAPGHAYRLEVALMSVRQRVADIEVYLHVGPVALLRLEISGFDRLARCAERERRRCPVEDYEAVRGRLRPSGRYHDTVFPSDAARILDAVREA